MAGFNYLQILQALGPEALVTLAALGVLFVDLGVMHEQPLPVRRNIAGGIAALGLVIAGLYLVAVSTPVALPAGMLVVNPATQWVKIVIAVLAIASLGLSLGPAVTPHVGEYFSLLLLATVGMMLMASAENLLAIFLAMELTSLSLYGLVAFAKSRPDATEAALKYFFFGSMAAAFVLFGMSLVYGVTGSFELRGVAAALAGKPFDPLLALAILMILAGFGFKVAAVPFHLWAPDAYQCAPTPVAALVASGSKVAGFFLLAKVMVLAFGGHAGTAALKGFQPGWLPALSVLALASMLLGNLAALAQRSLKRLLAYSAVAQAGYLLIGVAATAAAPTRAEALGALLFYVSTYALTAVGAFGVAAVAERAAGGEAISGLAGLARRSPWTAACLLVFMLSLAGLPPFAGFGGKFYLFATALKADAPPQGLLWLVVVALLFSPLALYYYLKVLKQAYVTPAAAGTLPFRLAWPEATILIISALAVFALGVWPSLLLDPLLHALKATGW